MKKRGGISYRILNSYIGKYNFSYKNISCKKCWKRVGGGVDMLYRIHCYVTKIPHVGIENFNQNNRILRYKIFPNRRKNEDLRSGLRSAPRVPLRPPLRPSGPARSTRWFQLILFFPSMKPPRFKFFCHFREIT